MFSKEIVDAISRKFDKRYETVPEFTNFGKVCESATDVEKLCLKYYYAFMPVSDLAAYSAELFLQIIRHSLMVKDKNLFNTVVPDDIYLNYVLQYRINNENIEFNREYLFNELLPRIEGKGMYDAVLEVNYWCLEKATYTGTDPRTVSPLTIIKNTSGRCGEESTFTVSALRSVGIPARQIYTPRWAHCDSNHAWVEAYIDGKWQFLGACEPEPVLNKGWFSGPASRGMLMHTRVFSTIYGGEEAAFSSDYMAELNLTANYTKTARVTVKVINAIGKGKIRVLFQVPNYCELSTILALEADENGEVSATFGLGDMMVHVTDGMRFINRKIDVRAEGDREVVVDFALAEESERDGSNWKFIPPVSDYCEADHGITDEMAEAHQERLNKCNDIRNGFAATFYKDETAKDVFDSGNFDVARFLVGAKGNTAEVEKFLKAETDIPFKYKVLMLNALPKKDLTDCESAILMEHLEYAYKFRDCYYEDIFAKYVLNPRIGFEMVVAYRKFIDGFFDAETKEKFVCDPKLIYEFIEENIRDAGNGDYKTLVAPPAGTLLLSVGAENAKKALFGAICRTLGIAARLNPRDGDLEYYENGEFKKITERETKKTSTLTLQCPEQLIYGGNLSIARLTSGRYQTLGFWDRGNSHDSNRGKNDASFDVEEGSYRILTNERLADGSMLINSYIVSMEPGKDSVISVEIPKEKAVMPAAVLNDFDFGGGSTLYSFLSSEVNNILAYIEPAKEPTEHLLRELRESCDEIKTKQVRIILATQSTNNSLEEVKALFDDIHIVNVPDTSFAQALCFDLGIKTERYPVIAFIGSGSRDATYYTSGYNVGSVKMALKQVE